MKHPTHHLRVPWEVHSQLSTPKAVLAYLFSAQYLLKMIRQLPCFIFKYLFHAIKFMGWISSKDCFKDKECLYVCPKWKPSVGRTLLDLCIGLRDRIHPQGFPCGRNLLSISVTTTSSNNSLGCTPNFSKVWLPKNSHERKNTTGRWRHRHSSQPMGQTLCSQFLSESVPQAITEGGGEEATKGQPLRLWGLHQRDILLKALWKRRVICLYVAAVPL